MTRRSQASRRLLLGCVATRWPAHQELIHLAHACLNDKSVLRLLDGYTPRRGSLALAGSGIVQTPHDGCLGPHRQAIGTLEADPRHPGDGPSAPWRRAICTPEAGPRYPRGRDLTPARRTPCTPAAYVLHPSSAIQTPTRRGSEALWSGRGTHRRVTPSTQARAETRKARLREAVAAPRGAHALDVHGPGFGLPSFGSTGLFVRQGCRAGPPLLVRSQPPSEQHRSVPPSTDTLIPAQLARHVLHHRIDPHPRVPGPSRRPVFAHRRAPCPRVPHPRAL